MKSQTATKTSEKTQDNARNLEEVINDIRAKWGKFSEQELSALKGSDDLVSQVSTKYGIKPDQAKNEVDVVLKGRKLGAGA
jgi:uncharacterized protein YjbJ (UPF0337 family)